MALIIAHPAYSPKLETGMTVEPCSPESIARAKTARHHELMRAVASLYAHGDDVVFATARPDDQARYLLAAEIGWDARNKGLAL